MWKLEIEKVINGYKLKETTEEITCEDQETFINREFVIQDADNDELKAPEELLWHVMEYFAIFGSKHDPERLRVTREKNDV